MKHFYATGNGGNGTSVYAFLSKKERDAFVAWDEAYDQKRAIKRNDARRHYKTASLVINGEIAQNGYKPITIDL